MAQDTSQEYDQRQQDSGSTKTQERERSEQQRSQSYDFAQQPPPVPMSFDSGAPAFTEGMVKAGTADIVTQLLSAHFEGVRQAVATAEKVSYLWSNQLTLQENVQHLIKMITPIVRQQVLQELRQNPSLIRG